MAAEESVALELGDVQYARSIVREAEVSVGGDRDRLATLEQVQLAYVSVREDVEAEYAALDREHVEVGEPLLPEEYLSVVHIVIQRDTKEEKQDGDIDLVIPLRPIVMQ